MKGYLGKIAGMADCCHYIVLSHSLELTVGVALTSLWWSVPATMALCTPAAPS